MQRLLFVLGFVAAGCGGETLVGTDAADGGGDGGARDAGRDAGDSGALDAGPGDAGEMGDAGPGDGGVLDAGIDAPLDAGPPPFTEAIDDGTVLPPHDLTDCAPTVAFAADGTAYLLHVTAAAAPGVQVARLEGRTWVPLAGPLNAADQPININSCPTMVVTAAGTPYVGFITESAITRQVRVRRFVSAAWADVLAIDSPISAFAPALDLAMTLDSSSDTPVVALAEFITDEHYVTVRRLVGSAFVREGPVGDRAARSVRVATRPDGTIVVLATSQIPGLVASVSELEAGVWTTLPTVDGGGVAPLLTDEIFADATSITVSYSILAGAFTVRTAVSTGAGFTSLGVEPLGLRSSTVVLGTRVIQAYERDVAASDIRAHDGAAWGTPITLPVSSAGTRLAVSSGRLFAAYTDGAVARVLRVNLP